MQGFGGAADAGVEDHGASDLVEAIEGFGGFATALVIKYALQVSDDGEGVIQRRSDANDASIRRTRAPSAPSPACVR